MGFLGNLSLGRCIIFTQSLLRKSSCIKGLSVSVREYVGVASWSSPTIQSGGGAVKADTEKVNFMIGMMTVQWKSEICWIVG